LIGWVSDEIGKDGIKLWNTSLPSNLANACRSLDSISWLRDIIAVVDDIMWHRRRWHKKIFFEFASTKFKTMIMCYTRIHVIVSVTLALTVMDAAWNVVAMVIPSPHAFMTTSKSTTGILSSKLYGYLDDLSRELYAPDSNPDIDAESRENTKLDKSLIDRAGPGSWDQFVDFDEFVSPQRIMSCIWDVGSSQTESQQRPYLFKIGAYFVFYCWKYLLFGSLIYRTVAMVRWVWQEMERRV
jgi:hypothetical protein